MGHRRPTAVAIWVVVFALLGVTSAHAAFPGTSGQSAYVGGGSAVHTIFPDGTGDRSVGSGRDPAWSPGGDRIAFWTSSPSQVWVARADGSDVTLVADGGWPAWSPDGTKLAYSRSGDIFVTDVLAGGETQLTNSANTDQEPAWSPDGTKIAFARDRFAVGTDGDVWVMDADGSNEVNLTDLGSGGLDDSGPNWSPDGTRIVFVRGLQGGTDEINVMNADGSGVVPLTSNSVTDEDPAWSPDGTKIVFASGSVRRITAMNTDGSSPVPITPADDPAFMPDWQPVRSMGYPRPKSASPVRVSLVPSYNPCFVSNSTHGPPLAYPSCDPPLQQSSPLTVGTPDANGEAANAVGSARLGTIVGDPGTSADEADVKVDADLTDVRCTTANGACPGGALSDFSGQVLLTVVVRITDRLNGPIPAGTMQNFSIRAPLTCVVTPNPATGASCEVATTMDSLIPGAVPEGKRSIWEFAAVEVYDAGPNGTGYANCPPTCGDGDERVFLRQGLFVP